MMNRGTRLFLILLCIFLAALSLMPTVKWYFFTPADMQEIANGTTDRVRKYAEQRAAEGFDQLITLTETESSMNGLIPEELSFLTDEAKANYKLTDRKVPKEWTVINTLQGFSDGGEVLESIEDHYRKEIQDLKTEKSKIIKLGLDIFGGLNAVIEVDEEKLAESLNGTPTEEQLNEALDQALEILNNRIDTFGLTEPTIRKVAADHQIMIEVPGDVNREDVEALLMSKGSLAFHLVDEEGTNAVRVYVDNGGIINENGRPADDSVLDKGLIVAGYYKKDNYGMDTFQSYVAINEEEGLSGDHIVEAKTYTDPNTLSLNPNISFSLDAEGGEIFYKLTSANKGNSLATVLDGRVKSIATIQAGIRQSGSISGFNREEADDLTLILKAAVMDVQLKVKSQNIVGATLGEETRDAGLTSIAIGFSLVFVFMLIWYRRAGLVADVALLLNLVFITAILSAFHFTLTMTSIAGLILNVGMAVDANVIIFERIKEELRLGKSRASAIEGGFKKAFWTIMDANITTLIAALFLSMLGSGAVKGFAVTLAVGIISSLFTALFVSHYLFDVGTEQLKKEKIKIGWGL